MDRPIWFVKQSGSVSGPLTSESLKRIVSDRNADAGMLVIRQGWSGWQTLGELRRFLFAEVGPATRPVTPLGKENAGEQAARELDWFIAVNGKQVGPMNEAQMKISLSAQSEKSRLYIIHRTWKDWKLASEVLPPPPPSQRKAGPVLRPAVATPLATVGEKRSCPKRAAVVGQVVLHNEQALVSTEAWNISESGLFLRCIEKPFAIGEIVKLTVKCPGLGPAFHIIGRVARYQTISEGGAGFAIHFLDVVGAARKVIARYVDDRSSSAAGVA